MKKLEKDLIDQLWFDDHMKEQVSRFEAIHEPHVPDLHAFEQFVHEHKQGMKRKLWKELAMFWLMACFVFGGMMWVMDRNLVWFLILQAVIAAGGIVFVSMTFGKGMIRKWKS